MRSVDVAIVGGGIAGLAAASVAARSGKSVALFERSATLGGRAQTTAEGDARLNLGPHALFVGGAGARLLQDLGIDLPGKRPGGYRVLRGGRFHTLPVSAATLARTGLLGPSAKIDLGRMLAATGTADAKEIDRVSLEDWVAARTNRADVREVFYALIRLSTYAHAPETVSAGAAIRQLRLPGGVRYLDGGWETIVEALRAKAIEAGAAIVPSQPVRRVVTADGAATGIVLADGQEVGSRAVIVATPPGPAAEITGVADVARWARDVVPTRGAVLDLVLSRLPNPRRVFALGIDSPIYFSVHSNWAKLAPRGQHVAHLTCYLAPGEHGTTAHKKQLEVAMDAIQPGWRDHVVFERFLPNLVVAGAMPSASTGGESGRPAVTVPGFANLFLAGDWVGAEGMLADAAFASGKLAAELAASAKMAALVPA